MYADFIKPCLDNYVKPYKKEVLIAGGTAAAIYVAYRVWTATQITKKEEEQNRRR